MNDDNRRRVWFDIETNAIDNPSVLWCVVFKEEVYDAESNSRDYRWVEYRGDDPALCDYLDRLVAEDVLFIGHNIIGYDCKHLERLINEGLLVSGQEPRRFFTPQNTFDTLVVSRLLWVEREGGHSLDSWGSRLRFPKIEHKDFGTYSPEMLEYCRNDVELTFRVYERLKRKLDERPDSWRDPIYIEHRIAWLAESMTAGGFYFNADEARRMLDELTTRANRLYDEMIEAFPPKVKVTQLKTKTKVEEVPFNPGSPKQVVERLNEFGWRPVDKTQGHILAEKAKDAEKLEKFRVYGWKVNERNLETLPADAPKECELLVEWMIVDSRRRSLVEWLKAYNETTGRIHPRFDPLGAKTHRWIHSGPNLGNIPTAKTIKYNSPHLREVAIDYGRRMRELWMSQPGSWLVGIDLDSAHLRIFGHLINDEKFINALVSGDKANGTDAHTLNKNKLGDVCVDRDRAKTFIFSFLNGAGASKVSDIFGCDMKNAKKALDDFIEAYPGLLHLKRNVIPKDAKRGYFEGVDGRLVVCNSAHHMMSVYLQNAEAVLMKYFIIFLMDALDKMGIDYHIPNTVHDEVIVEVHHPDKETAIKVGELGNECIRRVGEYFKYRCPLQGEYKIGTNWYQVH